ncbi:tetratricopeptide repeat protein [uncultured Maricaulis sp.]|uniref:tetratricopeptide repeat protein n=1 Tax=uncultured Maricaulis sp. TaxID=174710 RepID=UPI00260587D0|nr:tetratricopeptide repeat protein [uncultured Maricaulis sp.]
MRSMFFAAALAAAVSPMSFAQSCETDPSLVGHRTANGAVRAQYTAVERGEWHNVVHIGEGLVDTGLSARNRTAAWSNLCAGYAATGDVEAAIAACDSALELRDTAWRALNNRGVAHWLAGNQEAALADFQAANAASSGEDEVEANIAMVTCTTAS